MDSKADEHQLHVFFFPMMAYGHMIPIVDIARLVAARGAKATIVTTYDNAEAFTKITEGVTTYDNAKRESGHNIYVEALEFPAKEAKLQEGYNEASEVGKFFMAVKLLQKPFRQLVKDHQPDAIVADFCLPWAVDIAEEFGIPRIVFHGTSFFSLCILDSVALRHPPYSKVPFEEELLVVHGLPDKIEIPRSQLPDHLTSSSSPLTELYVQFRESELRSYGVIANSFLELEPAYAEHYRNVMGKKAWHVGPVSLRNKDMTEKALRGRKAFVDKDYVLSWLDSKRPNSVLYICFGSMSTMGTSQMMEIAMGLESSGVPFVWVIRTPKMSEAVEENFLPEGFEDRIQGKGLIIKDWAPQVLILDHQAIGGFMTHCGWNSVLEGISAGVPMITWPMFAEQFYNEKFVTQVLNIGIKVGVEKWNSWIEAPEMSMTKERVHEVVTQLMCDGDEAEERRRRARELKNSANRAVEEGGSSYIELTRLLEELKMYKQSNSSTKSTKYDPTRRD